MAKKKTILILIAVVILFIIIYLAVFQFKIGKKVLCYPRDYIRNNSYGNLNLEDMIKPRCYFSYGYSVYFRQSAVMDMNGDIYSGSDVKLKNSDPSSFECIDSNYAKDKNQVYYGGAIVEKADPATFQTLDWPNARDKNYYFNKNNIERTINENKMENNKTSYELLEDLLKNNGNLNGNSYGIEYYKIFREVKNSFDDGKIAVLFGLDREKTKECCSKPIGIFINDSGKLAKKFDILHGDTFHMYLDNAEWQNQNMVSYDFVIADEGGKKVTIRILSTE